MADDIRVGDIISFGPHFSVPSELVGKYFRVEAAERSDTGSVCAWKLSKPYNDPACTERYVPDDPCAHLSWPGMPFGKSV